MDVKQYGDILRHCFPSLNVTSIKFIGGGTYRVFQVGLGHGSDPRITTGSKLIFRFPHGAGGRNLLRQERDLCESLADLLPIPIPHYEFYSEGCQLFPHPVAGYHKLPGIPLEGRTCGPVATEKVARGLGEFLSALHSVPSQTALSVALPRFDPSQAIARQRALYREVRSHAFPVMSAVERAWTQDLFESYLTETVSCSYESVLVHGDLDSSNILWDPANGTLLAVIDFEEACLGDPAWDFSVLAAEHGPWFLQKMLDAYLPALDPGFEDRIAFHSQRVLFVELLYGLRQNDTRFSQHALARLRRAMHGLEPIGGWLVASTAETRRLQSHSH